MAALRGHGRFNVVLKYCLSANGSPFFRCINAIKPSCAAKNRSDATVFNVLRRDLKSVSPVRTVYSFNDDPSDNTDHKAIWTGVGVLCTLGALLYWKLEKAAPHAAATISTDTKPGVLRKDLPTFSQDEVEQHKSMEKRIWVTYRNGVYDITDYVPEHPGGTKILLGAGGSIEPFWRMYAAHENQTMYALLENFRIGNIVGSPKPVDMKDPYCNDPVRHPALRPNSAKPFNAEPPGALLVDNFTTPNELFFVRNHLPVPKVDMKKYRLKIAMDGGKTEVSYSLKDLKSKFPKHQVAVTLQCAGNRRSEMSEKKNVRGLSWQFDSHKYSRVVWC